MALDGQALSPKEFLLAFKPETTIGTENVSSMNLLNVDSVSSPSFNLSQVLDVRNGVGRTAKVADAFTDEKGTRKEISFSGTADNTTLPILLQAITTTAVGSSPASYDIAYNWTPPEIQVGTGSISDNLHTFTVAISHPEAGNDHSMVFKGCVLTALSLTGSMGTESGRIKISGTFATGSQGTFGQARPTSTTAYSSTNYSMTQWTAKTTIAGIADCVISDFTLNLENPSEFLGFNASGDPQAVVRGVPEIMCSVDATVKADDNTSGLHNSYKAGGTSASVLLSNHATWSSATTFGISMANGVLTGVDYSEASAMFYSVSIKGLASTSGDLIQIIA
mgnify:CR=1 FL=1|tara:strand:- start:720 stop:1727 length:1008 start_codon:yes stop_codon:yes gene_type:complete